MILSHIILATIFCAYLAYLFYVLVKPERF